MKIHITNLYNFNKEDRLVQRQHKFADAARSLGFYEMGIFSYPVETDTASELSKRLDGVIAALEEEDIVFMQLPTENGIYYEETLFNKIKAYPKTKIVLLFHDTVMLSDLSVKEECIRYRNLCKKADAVVFPSKSDERKILEELDVVLFCDSIIAADEFILKNEITNGSVTIESNGYLSLCKNDFYIKKLLMDAVENLFSKQNKSVKVSLDNKEVEMHISFGLYDKTGSYSVWVGVAMQSIIDNTNTKICFHILHDDSLSEENRNRFIQMMKDREHRVLFHYLSAELFSDFTEQVAGYTIGSLFRIVLPEMFPELDKIIYLDADILVNRDIKELWDIDIRNYCMAAVPDLGVVNGGIRPIPVKQKIVDSNRYFNSGVLYMNLERIRKKGNMKKMVMDYLLKTKESDMPDQDALNAIYNEETLLLDASWNCFAQHVRRNGEKSLQKKIYHYVGTPCILYSLTEMDFLYFETTRRTPWGMEECRKQLRDSLVRMNDRITQFEKMIPHISDNKKKHIFYGKETLSMKNMYKLLSLRKDDYRILEENTGEENGILPCRKFETLLSEKDEFIVFVLPEADNWSAIGRLKQMGLVNEKDFFVIPRILSSHQGGYVR